MGIPVLIMGESGSGKTYSIKNLDPETTGLFLVEKGTLPFRNKFPNALKNATYSKIMTSLSKHKLKRYVIDDSHPHRPRDSQESPPTPQFKSISSLVFSFLYSPTLTSILEKP